MTILGSLSLNIAISLLFVPCPIKVLITSPGSIESEPMFKLIKKVIKIKPIKIPVTHINLWFFFIFINYLPPFLTKYINTGTPNKAVKDPIGVS